MNTKSSKKEIEQKKINVVSEYVLFRDIEESPINAQEMDQEDFRRLTQNIKRDGILTTSPLLMRQEGKNKYMCVSGHHRIRAGIKAKLDGAICLIMDEVDESTRIRLQLAHNDISGKPNKDLLDILIQQLNDFDIDLIDNTQIDGMVKEAKEVDVTAPTFRYINICLIENSRERFVEMLENIKQNDDINYLLDNENYDKIKDLLSYAFKKGFRSAGQSIGVFMDIVDNNKDQIKR